MKPEVTWNQTYTGICSLHRSLTQKSEHPIFGIFLSRCCRVMRMLGVIRHHSWIDSVSSYAINPLPPSCPTFLRMGITTYIRILRSAVASLFGRLHVCRHSRITTSSRGIGPSSTIRWVMLSLPCWREKSVKLFLGSYSLLSNDCLKAITRL